MLYFDFSRVYIPDNILATQLGTFLTISFFILALRFAIPTLMILLEMLNISVARRSLCCERYVGFLP